MFVLSRAVSHDCLVAWKLAYVVRDLAHGDEPRAGNVTDIVRRLISDIHYVRLAVLDHRVELIDRDAASAVRVSYLSPSRFLRIAVCNFIGGVTRNQNCSRRQYQE